MTWRTRTLVSSETRGLSCSTRLTAERDNPHASAMSSNVTRATSSSLLRSAWAICWIDLLVAEQAHSQVFADLLDRSTSWKYQRGLRRCQQVVAEMFPEEE